LSIAVTFSTTLALVPHSETPGSSFASTTLSSILSELDVFA